MKTWSKFPIILGAMGWVLANAWAETSPPSGTSAAIQAIQQAPDPSAVVAAYANGVAADRSDAKLNAAYVARMVDLGLPELAYHQAEFLTNLKSNDGLAWAVVAYVHARRGEMEEAISAINLAGQFAPENIFVQRTAGEIVAWYDTKAEPAKLPDNVKDGLTKLRSSMEHYAAFTSAYSTARSAYQAQSKAAPEGPATAESAQPQAEEVVPTGYAVATAPAPDYYSGYYYDWGPQWVEPSPSWWWQPVGFFGGCSFFPFSTVIVFDHHDFFHQHHSLARDHFVHNQNASHDRSFHHDGMNVAFHDSNRAFFHQDGKTSFFGTSARANHSLAQIHTAPHRADSSSASHNTTGSPDLRSTTALPETTSSAGVAGERNMPRGPGSMTSTGTRGKNSSIVVVPPRLPSTMPNSATIAGSTPSVPTMPNTATAAGSTPSIPTIITTPRLAPTGRVGNEMPSPTFHNSVPRQNFSVPEQDFVAPRTFTSPHMTPQSMPSQPMAPPSMAPANRGFVGGGVDGGGRGNHR